MSTSIKIAVITSLALVFMYLLWTMFDIWKLMKGHGKVAGDARQKEKHTKMRFHQNPTIYTLAIGTPVGYGLTKLTVLPLFDAEAFMKDVHEKRIHHIIIRNSVHTITQNSQGKEEGGGIDLQLGPATSVPGFDLSSDGVTSTSGGMKLYHVMAF
jgi:hypothetical protein